MTKRQILVDGGKIFVDEGIFITITKSEGTFSVLLLSNTDDSQVVKTFSTMEEALDFTCE